VAFELNYSFFDRLVHRIAFAVPALQLTAADIEDTFFSAVYDGVSGTRPIFVTSLPRAGTTLMLEALTKFPSLATHVYRDMPFVMAPVLWARLSASFRKPQELHERAHGDGMQVGYDSPEAFEEVLWRAFWPKKYLPSRIALWEATDDNASAREFFGLHMKKIVALRVPTRAGDGRYISKNNANVARLDLLGRLFPDSRIVIPVRHPVAHAQSLLRQHQSFLAMHRDTRFVRDYMADIGHYEFGELHRPIAFPTLEPMLAGRDPMTLDYWLAYWIAAFDYVRSRRELALLISYERACTDPRRTLASLCERLEIPDDGRLPEAAGLFRPQPAGSTTADNVDRGLVERAEQLHRELIADQLA
jgi:hypothetical protein